MVATPYPLSAATALGSARVIFLTAMADCPSIESPLFVEILGYEYLAAHEKPRCAQQRRLQHFRRFGRIHGQDNAELAAGMLHGYRLAVPLRHPRVAVRHAAG